MKKLAEENKRAAPLWPNPFDMISQKRAEPKLDGAFYSLAVQFLKKVAPDCSLAVAGYHMVKRCVSLICVDPQSGKTLSAITAMLFFCTPTANASDVLQAFCRFCGTNAVMSFHNAEENRERFAKVSVLVPQHVLDVARAVKNFAANFCTMNGRPALRHETLAFLAPLDVPIREGEHPHAAISAFVMPPAQQAADGGDAAATAAGAAGAAAGNGNERRLLASALHDVCRPFIASAVRGRSCFLAYAQASFHAVKGDDADDSDIDKKKKAVIVGFIWRRLESTHDNNGQGYTWAELLKHLNLNHDKVMDEVEAMHGRALPPADRQRGLAVVFRIIEQSCLTRDPDKRSRPTYTETGYYRSYGMCFVPGKRPNHVVRTLAANLHVHRNADAARPNWSPPAMLPQNTRSVRKAPRLASLECCNQECRHKTEGGVSRKMCTSCGWRRCMSPDCAEAGKLVAPGANKGAGKNKCAGCSKVMTGTLERRGGGGGGGSKAPAAKRRRTSKAASSPASSGVVGSDEEDEAASGDEEEEEEEAASGDDDEDGDDGGRSDDGDGSDDDEDPPQPVRSGAGRPQRAAAAAGQRLRRRVLYSESEEEEEEEDDDGANEPIYISSSDDE